MKYLLDTNTCIRYLNGTSRTVLDRILAIADDDIATSAITRAELYFGAEKSRDPEHSRRGQDRFLARFRSLAFDDAAAAFYASVRARTERSGTPIGPNDLLIAAIALTHSLTLVTHNTREFSRVPDLSLDDWEI
ncbi:MAG: PIN domain-containing protein [Acidobacteriota bacterium]|nr:PIN domain-containing protein [Acidobacteriota bacterium]